jgi:Fur family transcriptional regulator, ferric uptake regulator
MSNEYDLGTVEVALSPRERFEEFLQSKGKRVTQQRLKLVDQIFSRHEHFDADALIDEIARTEDGKRKAVSRPTVYRTLNELVDAGLLRKFELDGRAVFEHDYGYPQHDHLYCKQCRQLIEFQSQELIDLIEQVARQQRFRVAGHRLIVNGVCETCQKSKRRVRRKVDLI